MSHQANWKEIEEVWIEMANCVCNIVLDTPCLHCDSNVFKVWYQMKFGEAAFSYTNDFLNSETIYYCPVGRVRGKYEYRIKLPYMVCYQARNNDWYSYACDTYFKTVKEAVMLWRELRLNEPQS